MQLSIRPYTDGPHPPGFREIVANWTATWNNYYCKHAKLEFLAAINVKVEENRTNLPPDLSYLERIRNPDVYFVETTTPVELGGIEITDHSPDGSNIEKRYPFLWAGRRTGINAFTITRYLKQRPAKGGRATGQINRFPFRHAFRNEQLLKEWTPAEVEKHSHLVQYIPLRELHLEDIDLVPATIRELLVSWADLGEFFAHTLAARVLPAEVAAPAREWLGKFKDRLNRLAQACMENATRETEASSLLKLKDRWIQVYNTRPDSGHWERGEGQFDSIDGRIMFTLDEISLLDPRDRPKRFEFWLPQMASTHAWIAEQREREYGSKRLRNLLVELAEHCTTRFADQLTEEDWQILVENRQLLLERLDWASGIYKVADQVLPERREQVTRSGITSRPDALLRAILAMLSDENLYFSSHRAYMPGWRAELRAGLLKLPPTATVLVPRIPAALLKPILDGVKCSVLPAENCSKTHLFMLRQLHRSKS